MIKEEFDVQASNWCPGTLIYLHINLDLDQEWILDTHISPLSMHLTMAHNDLLHMTPGISQVISSSRSRFSLKAVNTCSASHIKKWSHFLLILGWSMTAFDHCIWWKWSRAWSRASQDITVSTSQSQILCPHVVQTNLLETWSIKNQ